MVAEKNKKITQKEVPRKMMKMVPKEGGGDQASIGVQIRWRYMPTILTYLHFWMAKWPSLSSIQ
jgi:hypothetical protein